MKRLKLSYRTVWGLGLLLFAFHALAQPEPERSREGSEDHLELLTHPLELGLTWSQPAYRVPGTVAWMDREALVRDFPALAKFDDAQLKTWILDNFSRMTKAHFDLAGVVAPAADATQDGRPQDPRMVFHPVGYGRAAVAVGIKPDVAPPTGSIKDDSFYLVDLKGVGWGKGPYISSFRPHVPYLASLLRNPERIRPETVAWAKGIVREIQKEQKIERKKLKSPVPSLATVDDPAAFDEHSRHRQFILHIGFNRAALVFWTWVHKVLKSELKQQTSWFRWQRQESAPRIQKNLETLAALLAHMDYGSGQLGLHRAFREVVAQKVVQEVLRRAQHGKRWDENGIANPGTVETYFIIRLPWETRDLSGSYPAAILGRRATWRFGQSSDFDTWRADHQERVKAIGIWDLFGSPQSGAFSQLVDFENMTLTTHPRLRGMTAPISTTELDVWANRLGKASIGEESEDGSIQDAVDQEIAQNIALIKEEKIQEGWENSSLRFAPRTSNVYQYYNQLLAGDVSAQAFSKLAGALSPQSGDFHDLFSAAIMAARKRPERVVKTLVRFASDSQNGKVPEMLIGEKTRRQMISSFWRLEDLFINLYWVALPRSPEAARHALIQGLFPFLEIRLWHLVLDPLPTSDGPKRRPINDFDVFRTLSQELRFLFLAISEITDPDFFHVELEFNSKMRRLNEFLAAYPYLESAFDSFLLNFSPQFMQRSQFRFGSPEFKSILEPLKGKFPWSVWAEGRGLPAGLHPCERIFGGK